MRKTIRNVIKKAVLQLLPDSSGLRYIVHKPRLKTWMSNHPEKYPVFDDRTKMYDFINGEIALNKTIHYLEFGVFHGESIRRWRNINTDKDSRFFGFDTFTGLPEDWDSFSLTVRKEAFDAGGEVPKILDARVSFIRGLFQDTLPMFVDDYKPAGQLIIHNDSDLYSATLYVLTYLDPIMIPGTVVIFDEFYNVLHEFRALEDYCSSYLRIYEVLAATKDHVQVAIRMK